MYVLIIPYVLSGTGGLERLEISPIHNLINASKVRLKFNGLIRVPCNCFVSIGGFDAKPNSNSVIYLKTTINNGFQKQTNGL